MIEPKISGLVNNCALNCALPILMKGIDSLAMHETQNSLDSIADNPVVHSYYRLKEIFAGFYGIDCQADFNWRVFSKFLNSYSFYAKELMLLPIFRVFIREQKAQLGTENGIVEKPEFFADMQEDGRYNMLSGDIASVLFYQPFGINIEIFTEGSTYTQKLVSPHKKYPFGETPCFGIYLQGAHFEIQPHNAPEMAQAVRDFESEVQNLPPKLLEIHERFTTSQTMYESDEALSKIVPVVFELIMEQLIHEREAAEIPVPEACCAEKEPVPELPELPKQPIRSSYALEAEKYAETGKKIHSDTPSGRQTFAMILLTLQQEDESNQRRAQQLIQYVQTLVMAASSNKPLAAHLLDQLNKVIINNNGQLNAKQIEDAENEIKLHLGYIDNLSSMRKLAKYVKLVKASERTIEQSWIYYKNTKDEDYLTAIQLTEALTKPEAPSAQLLKDYQEFTKKLNGKGSWGKIIAGLMCATLGLAFIVTASLTEAVSLGIATPISLPCIAAGIGLFRIGMDKGLYKEAKQVHHEVRQIFSQGV